MTRFQGVGNPLTLKGLITNRVSLASGNVSILSPAGEYWIRTGPYTTIQQLDPITGIWWKIGGGVVALAGVDGGAVALLVSASPDLTAKGVHAGNTFIPTASTTVSRTRPAARSAPF